jgi:hypothetical protein
MFAVGGCGADKIDLPRGAWHFFRKLQSSPVFRRPIAQPKLVALGTSGETKAKRKSNPKGELRNTKTRKLFWFYVQRKILIVIAGGGV